MQEGLRVWLLTAGNARSALSCPHARTCACGQTQPRPELMHSCFSNAKQLHCMQAGNLHTRCAACAAPCARKEVQQAQAARLSAAAAAHQHELTLPYRAPLLPSSRPRAHLLPRLPCVCLKKKTPLSRSRSHTSSCCCGWTFGAAPSPLLACTCTHLEIVVGELALEQGHGLVKGSLAHGALLHARLQVCAHALQAAL